MTNITRRSLAIGLSAVATVPVIGSTTAGGGLLHQVRTFAQQLLADSSGLTAGEWLERKRIANLLLAFIGDDFEPWTPAEIGILEEISRTRTSPMWTARA